MLQIITNIPLFVWPIFIMLLVVGLKASKGSTLRLPKLLVIPSLFFVWSCFSYFGKYGDDPLSIMYWLSCLGVGLFIGFSQLKTVDLRFDRQKRSVEMPGSWVPLILSMSIFCSKFAVGMMGAMAPHLSGSILFLGLELFATLILGVFVGRRACCLLRYRALS